MEFLNSPPPPPPPRPSSNLVPRQPMQGSIHPRPSLEALEKELKEEKIKEEIIACKIAQRRMIEEQVRREMDIGHGMMSLAPEKRASFPLAQQDEFNKSRKPSPVQIWVKKTAETQSLNQKVTTTERMASATISKTTIFNFQRPEQKDWTCDLCHVRTTSKVDLNSHLKGKKHLAKLALVKNDSGCSDSVSMPIVPAPKPKVFQVAIYKGKQVNIEEKCNNEEEILKDLRNDKKPQAVDRKIVEEKYRTKKVNQNWTCDLRQVSTTTKDDLSNHFKGKKHLGKLALVEDNSIHCRSLLVPSIPANSLEALLVAMYGDEKVNTKARCNDKEELLQEDSRNDKKPEAVNSKALNDNNGCNGSYLMPMDTHEKLEVSTAKENLSLVKGEALEEEKKNEKEVNMNTFCDLCQVKLPGMGLNVHLRGKKHQAKYSKLSANNEFAKSTTVEDDTRGIFYEFAKSTIEHNGFVYMPMDAQGGTKVSIKVKGISQGGPVPALGKAEVPWSAGRSTLSDKDRVLKTVKGILNRLTAQNFDLLIGKLVCAGITTPDIQKDVVELVFDKAVLEPTFCPIYAQLCSALIKNFLCEEPVIGMQVNTFKQLLLNKCQETFEGAYMRTTKVRKLAGSDQELEPTHKERLVKLRDLGNIRLIGELFKQHVVVTARIVHEIIKQLLVGDGETCPDTEKVEAVCLLLNIVGKQLDENPKSCPFNNVYFSRLKELTKSPQLSQRLRFMVCNIVDLRANNWVPQHKEVCANSISKIQNGTRKTLAMFPGTTACTRNVLPQRFEIECPLSFVVVFCCIIFFFFFFDFF